MKKYVIFSVSFIMAYVILQMLSGLVLTILYTPTLPAGDTTSLSSQVEFGSVSIIPPLIIALIALGTAFGTTKLIARQRKAGEG